MAGIYIHIPFCKQACYYCDFHFSTSLKYRKEIVDSICKELNLRKSFLGTTSVSSIYFGGGTPSLLTPKEIEAILQTIHTLFSLDNMLEITIECNPDDITPLKLSEYHSLGFNRISLGIQTLNQTILKKLNRAHNAQQAVQSIEHIRASSINKLSVDVILASHDSNLQTLQHDLKTLINYHPEHISTYILTIEESTVFGNLHKKGKLLPIDETLAETQYNYTIDFLESHNYEHYEISNFARPAHRAAHNSSYWQNSAYLGVGPSAHSYDKINRYYNVANNAKYIQSIRKNIIPETVEKLTLRDKINETIMLSLRTWQGLNLSELELTDKQIKSLINICNDLIQSDYITQKKNRYHLTQKGKIVSDYVIAEMMQ